MLYKKNGNILCHLKEKTANENYSVRKTKKNRLMLLSSCDVCSKRKSRYIKNEELNEDLLKMKKIVSKYFLTGYKFIPEMHLKI